MKVLSLIKSHKIVSSTIAVILVAGISTTAYVYSQKINSSEQPAVAQAAKTEEVAVPNETEETKSEEKVKEANIKEETPSSVVEKQQTTPANSEPEYSAEIPQLVLNKAAEMQNARKSMNERYMSDIFWIYEKRPELLQEDTYAATLAKMKSIYTSELEPKSAMFFTLQLKEIF